MSNEIDYILKKASISKENLNTNEMNIIIKIYDGYNRLVESRKKVINELKLYEPNVKNLLRECGLHRTKIYDTTMTNVKKVTDYLLSIPLDKKNMTIEERNNSRVAKENDSIRNAQSIYIMNLEKENKQLKREIEELKRYKNLS